MNRSMLLAMVVGTLAVIAGISVWNAKTRTSASTIVTDDPARDEAEAREALRARPEDFHARLRLAGSLRRQGHAREAEAELVRAIQEGLSEDEGRREVILQMAPTDWPDKMEGLFQKVIRDNPEDREVLTAVAASYAAKGRWESAEPLYARLIALEPGKTEWRFQRGLARMRTAFYVTAVEDFRAVLAADPENYPARLYLGHSLLGDARMPEAERELQACRQQRPNAAEPLVGLASCASERNDLASAETLLNQAVKLDDKSSQVFQELSTLYLRQQRTEAAITALRRLLALDPNHRQGHLQISQALLAAGNKEEAAKHEAIYQELDRREEERLNARRGAR